MITFLTTDRADQAERELMRREVEGLPQLSYATGERERDERWPAAAHDDLAGRRRRAQAA